MSDNRIDVVRDALRELGLDLLADNLEWAASAVRHRDTLLSAARWAATEGGACADCGSAYVHAAKCPTAEMLHALDAEWSQKEVEAAHVVALAMARQRSDGPRLTAAEMMQAWQNEALYETREAIFGPSSAPLLNLSMPDRQAAINAIDAAVADDPERLTYSAPAVAIPAHRREALLSATLETDRPPVAGWDGQWPVAHADSPSADAGTEAVTPPARPPPRR